MNAKQFRKAIMEVMQETHSDAYWISTNMVDAVLVEEHQIFEATPQRVGTNLNILKRFGYVDRLNETPAWKLTEKGIKCDLNKITF